MTTSLAAPSDAATATPPQRERRWRVNPRALPYLLLAPALLFELLVHVLPMLVGVGISFLRLNLFFLRHWIGAPSAGLGNYGVAVEFDGSIGAELLRSFGVTVAFAVCTVTLSWLFGVFAATMLQRSFPGRTLLRGLFLVPYALPIYTAVIVWRFLLNRRDGMVNHLFGTDTFWLLGHNAFASLVLTEVWRLWPFAFLALTAGMQSIPTEVYDAAEVDGVSIWQRFTRITLPMLRPVNQVVILVLFLWTFNEFTVPYTLFDQSVPSAANLISIHVYQSSFLTWNFGLGSAMSVLLLLFLLVVSAGYLLLTSRRARRA